MEELAQILCAHAARYPKMQPADAVKLIYQNEFGGGHLIQDEASCLRYLRQEFASVVHNAAAPRTEAIGNGLLRVHLAALEKSELDALGEAFLRSAAARQGDPARFTEKLALLRRLTVSGLLPFSLAPLDDYLRTYRAAGLPMISHSAAYRQAYRPAYRIVLLTLWPQR